MKGMVTLLRKPYMIYAPLIPISFRHPPEPPLLSALPKQAPLLFFEHAE